MPPIYSYSVIILSLRIGNFNKLFGILHTYGRNVYRQKSLKKPSIHIVFCGLSYYNIYRSNMKKSERIKKKINNYLFDHRVLRFCLDNGIAFLHATVAAIIFAFGFCAFITPADSAGLAIATGGVSGVSQTIALIMRLCGAPESITGNNTIQSIGYFVINIPILTFAFLKIGKRFAIISLINVGLSSLFIFLFSHPEFGFTQAIAKNALVADHLLVRVLFGGLCVGLSSAIAYRGDVSCGGMDVFNYYFALRKSTSTGKYGILTNGIIIASYALILLFDKGHAWEESVISFFFSITYLFIANIIVDSINLRNKKIQIQIVTTSDYLAPVLIANFPHGATVVNGEGAYSHQSRKIIYMVVSSSQVKSVIALSRKVDHHAFITVTALVQVYGNFFIKPVE